VGSLWSTKKETDDKLIEMQTKLRELIVYLMFLGIVTTGMDLYIIIINENQILFKVIELSSFF
jgi:hypothetical protein